MRQKVCHSERTCGVTADVKDARRQVAIHRADWHMRGCQLESGPKVFVGIVGTFGVSSTSYSWCCSTLRKTVCMVAIIRVPTNFMSCVELDPNVKVFGHWC